ncbi:MAG: carbamoyl phosphate synthase large subunit, partial [Rhodobiaceae bacterium]|nr:carbamoyl phosphate synthase large subunit [Rhodobiaceae bacterium]
AGIHSGDSACSLPTHSLSPAIVEEIERQTRDLARGLNVVGLMNVQYAIKDDEIYVLEVNPRASRTVPFVAKTIGAPVAKIAARLMAGSKTGETLNSFTIDRSPYDHIAVKEAVFPFARFPGVDTVLGPEMRSTGEVMGLARDYALAFAKSQLAGGTRVPLTGNAFVSVRDGDKMKLLETMQVLEKLGFGILATGGTQRFLIENGIAAKKINKVLEGRPHIVDAIENGDVAIVINTTEGSQALADSRSLRRAALMHKVPYYTTVAGAIAAVQGIEAVSAGSLDVEPLQAYVAGRKHAMPTASAT